MLQFVSSLLHTLFFMLVVLTFHVDCARTMFKRHFFVACTCFIFWNTFLNMCG
jgi:hypothetical protein